MSQRRANRSRNEGPDLSELQDSIKECVRFIVCREGSKIPIKRSEIIKHLTTVCQTASNQMNTVIIEADKVLKRVYGYKLVQVRSQSAIQYIVVLNKECESILPSVTDDHHRRLLVAALMHIFMNSAPVKEEDLWKFLIEAGLLEESDNASRKLFTTTFTRQMYLQYTKVKMVETNTVRSEFDWGQRATEEVPKLFLLNKMAEAFGKTPDHWCEQYKEATSSVEAAQS